MKTAKFILVVMLSIVSAAFFYGCSSNSLYEDMPNEIQKFISQYYPNSELESFTSSENGYTVTIKNGATLNFGTNYKWVRINGNGHVLPQVLLFNDFPPELYSYLQATDNTNSVYMVTRNSKTYTVQLFDNSITYDISTGKITGDDVEN